MTDYECSFAAGFEWARARMDFQSKPRLTRGIPVSARDLLTRAKRSYVNPALFPDREAWNDGVAALLKLEGVE